MYCGLQSLPVLAWIHALALTNLSCRQRGTQGFTPSYVIEPHVEKRPTFEQLHLNWQCDHTELQRLPFYYLNYVLMFYVLTGQNYCQELKWLLYNTKQGNYKVPPTVFLRLKRLSYEGKNNCFVFLTCCNFYENVVQRLFSIRFR